MGMCRMDKSRFLKDYPDVLLPEECMAVLSVGRNTMYTLLKSGAISSVRVGKQYRIPKACLLKYLGSCYNKNRVDGSAPDSERSVTV